jgi:hypothetical protein
MDSKVLVKHISIIKITVFRVVTHCSMIKVYNVLEEFTASIFMAKE